VKKCILIIFLALLQCLCGKAQNLNGFWKGSLTMKGGCFPENNIELQITISDEVVIGTSYQYLDVNNYIRKDLTGFYNKETNSLSLQEGDVTAYQIPTTCVICVKKYELAYSKTNNTEVLQGEWSGTVLGTGALCMPGTIILSRTNEPIFAPPSEIKADTGTIRLDFYDNGEIDGDSITVLVNKQVVVSHQRLSAKPITVYVKVDPPNPFQQIEMIAENLGSIPPNTALLMITAGKKKFRLFLSSTQNNRAIMRFVYSRDYTDDESHK
jgi:hypothetical protein